MQRHRCTKCRNPIRGVGVPCPGATSTQWYHSDCWEAVRSAEQEGYEAEVRSGGLSALLAPYHARASAALVERQVAEALAE